MISVAPEKLVDLERITSADIFNAPAERVIAQGRLLPPDATVPKPLAGQLALMLAEAVANAVRHGGASNIDVMMEKGEASLIINIRDNGKGFSAQPTQDAHRELAMANVGAASLHERVCALGGSLTVSSSRTGAELAIRFPVS
jgi:signal transduction histidine kinase